jgi:uncharacterized protein (TIGR00369 family)
MAETAAPLDQEQTASLRRQMPFVEVLGVGIVRAAPGEVLGRAEWAPERCTGGGILHGGYLMSAVDSVGALCASLNLPAGAGTSTIESKTNFFRAVRGGTIELRAVPVHVGRTTIVVQTDVTDAEGKLVSRSTQTQAVLQPR